MFYPTTQFKTISEINLRLKAEADDRRALIIRRIGLACVAVIVVLLASCSEPPSDPVQVDPLEEFYAIRTTPDWPEYHLAEMWLSEGGRYALRDSLWFIHDSGLRTGYPIECRSDGREIWIATPGKQHAIRGTLLSSGIIARYIVEGPNGQPGPTQSITFRRVQ